MTTPHYWQEALDYLSKDEVMFGLIANYPNLTLQSRGNAFETLLRSIVGQQISVIAAQSIWQRIEQQIKPLTPDVLSQYPIEQLKKLGLSNQKSHYLHNIASYFLNNKVNTQYFKNRSFAEIQTELISIKGIGPWTIEMFAIFYLTEPDIFPIKDLGLIKAVQRQYGDNLDIEKIKELASKWQPYRTVATWYLWRSIDNEVVQY